MPSTRPAGAHGSLPCPRRLPPEKEKTARFRFSERAACSKKLLNFLTYRRKITMIRSLSAGKTLSDFSDNLPDIGTSFRLCHHKGENGQDIYCLMPYFFIFSYSTDRWIPRTSAAFDT